MIGFMILRFVKCVIGIINTDIKARTSTSTISKSIILVLTKMYLVPVLAKYKKQSTLYFHYRYK